MEKLMGKDDFMFCVRISPFFAREARLIPSEKIKESFIKHARLFTDSEPRIFVIQPDALDKSDPLGQTGFWMWQAEGHYTIYGPQFKEDDFTGFRLTKMHSYFDVYAWPLKLASPLPDVVKALAWNDCQRISPRQDEGTHCRYVNNEAFASVFRGEQSG